LVGNSFPNGFKEAGLDQRELASRLQSPQNVVSRIECGERRVDLIEAYQIFEALDCDPVAEVSDLIKEIRENPPPKGKAGRVSLEDRGE